MSHVTIYDIARQAGLSKSTVARALQDHPHVRPSTRDRVQSLAASLGYKPDPALSSLSRFRRAPHAREQDMPIAYLYHDYHKTKPPFELKPESGFPSAIRRASALGYNVLPIDIGEFASSHEISRVLVYRGVRAILLRSFQSCYAVNLDWDTFACVFVGPENDFPRLDSVAPNFSDSVKLAVTQALERGFKRIGFALFDHRAPGTDEAFRAAALFHRERLGRALGLQPRLFDFSGRGDLLKFRDWFETDQPDVILSSNILAYYFLAYPQAFHSPLDPIAVPKRVSYINLRAVSLPEEDHVAQVDVVEHQMGAIAVDLLHGRLRSNWLGLPTHPARHLLPVRWKPGTTLVAAP